MPEPVRRRYKSRFPPILFIDCEGQVGTPLGLQYIPFTFSSHWAGRGYVRLDACVDVALVDGCDYRND